MNIVKELERIGQQTNAQSHDSMQSMVSKLNISQSIFKELAKSSQDLYCLVEFGANNADI